MVGVASLAKYNLSFVKIYSLKNLFHNLPVYLNLRYGIKSVIEDLIINNIPFHQEELGDMYNYKEIINLMYIAEFREKYDDELIKKFENEIDLYDTYLKSYIYHSLGILYLQKKEYSSAKRYIELSVKLNSSNIIFHYSSITLENKLKFSNENYKSKNVLKSLYALNFFEIEKSYQTKYKKILKKIISFLLKRKKSKEILNFIYKNDLIDEFSKQYEEALKIELHNSK